MYYISASAGKDGPTDFIAASTCARIPCGATKSARATTCDEQHESGTAQQHDDNHFFHHYDSPFFFVTRSSTNWTAWLQ
jgi:hypothetical protein